jgi:general secretion pathway protein L
MFFDELQRQLMSYAESAGPLSILYLSGPDALEVDLNQLSKKLGVVVELLPYPHVQAGDAPSDAPVWPGWAIPLGLALRETAGKGSTSLNLLTGPFAKGGGVLVWKDKAIAVGVFAAILLGLWGAAVGVESSRKSQKLEVLTSSIRQTFTQALPKVTNIVDEVQQLGQKVSELEERASSLGSLLNKEVSPIRVLREMSSRISPELKVEFREYLAQEDRVKVEGVTTSFDAIDKIQATLKEYPWFSSVTVSDAKAGVEPGKVIFKMTLLLKTPEG